MRKFIFLNLLLIFILSVSFSFAQNSNSQKKVKLKATVIAVYSFPTSGAWHRGAVWLIVRLDNNKDESPSYAHITVEYLKASSLPDEGYPSELIDQARKWEFRVIRDASQEEPVPKYLKSVDEDGKDISEEVALPAWRLLRGAKSEKIPVGEILPYYKVGLGDYKKVE